MTELPSRTERKELRRQQTKERFFSAATQLIQDRGIENISMEEIAQQAGYAKGSVYNYFSGKNEFICEMIVCGVRQMKESARTILTEGKGSFGDRLDRFHDAILEQLSSSSVVMEEIDLFLLRQKFAGGKSANAKLIEKIESEVKEFLDGVSRFFEEGIRAGRMIDVDPTLAVVTFLRVTLALRRPLAIARCDAAKTEQFYQSFRNWLVGAGAGVEKEKSADA